MAPLRRGLALGIILLLVSHLSESSPSPDEETVNKVSTQNRAGEDENTVKEDEPVASKLNLSIQKALRLMSFDMCMGWIGIVFSHAGLEYSNELPFFCVLLDNQANEARAQEVQAEKTDDLRDSRGRLRVHFRTC